MNLLAKFEAKQIAKLTEGKSIPAFRAGDNVKVKVKIIEGTTERVQAFEGTVIRKHNDGLNSTFAVKKVSNGENVERTFPLYSPRLESIEIVKRGKVRRAKLYYMRKLQGKAARIEERRDLPQLAAAKSE